MTDQPLVSAITIFLNAERFIEEAIESVFAQTYPAWELLLVDDGSTDGSTAIARRYADAYPDRVRYLEHEDHQNRGMSASRNLGICHARGEYIAFLDADDIWLPKKLERQVALMEAHPEAGMLMGASQYWYSWTGRPEDAGRDVIVTPGVPSNTLVHPPAAFLDLYPVGSGAAPCNGSLLVRRVATERVWGFEDQFVGMYEDQAFLTKMYLAVTVYVTSMCLDRYRQHPYSCSASVGSGRQYHDARRHFLIWLENYVQTQGPNDPTVNQALDFSLLRYRSPIKFMLTKVPHFLSALIEKMPASPARHILPGRLRSKLRARLRLRQGPAPVNHHRQS